LKITYYLNNKFWLLEPSPKISVSVGSDVSILYHVSIHNTEHVA